VDEHDWVTTEWTCAQSLSHEWAALGLGAPVIRSVMLPREHDDSAALLERCWTQLQADERAVGDQLHGTRRVEWLLGRAALKESVRDWQATFGYPVLAAHQIPVHVGIHGAPRIAACGSVAPEVSLAHTRTVQVSGGFAGTGFVIAVASAPGAPVGIDVEHAERRLPALDRIFDEREQALIENEFGALGLVVAKEAAAKASGLGLQGSLRRWPVLGRRGPMVFVGDEIAGDEPRQVRAVRLVTDGPWIVGICCSAWDCEDSTPDVLN